MSENCYRHPETLTKRRCYSCRKPICRACQLNLDHHIFCGEDCHQTWLAAAAEKKSRPPRSAESAKALEALRFEVQGLAEKMTDLSRRLETVVSDADGLRARLDRIEVSASELAAERVNPSRAKSRIPGRLHILIAVLAGLLAGVAFARVGQWTVSQSQPPAAVENAPAAEPPNLVYDDLEPLLAPPTLDLGSPRLTLRAAQATFSGYAPGAVTVTLYVNGQEVAEAQVEDQGFVFAKVPLTLGLSVIQVKAVDAAGNAAFSFAHLVVRENPEVAVVRPLPGLNRMRGPRDRPYLALTLDAGAANQRAEQVLDILREKRIKTTFFLTGQFIEKYPEIVKRIVADGHEVGNHTYDHPHLTTYLHNRRFQTSPEFTKARFQDQMLKTKKLFEDLTGAAMAPWWRAPYGEHNREIRQWAEEIGFHHIDWTRSPSNYDMLDWIASPGDPHYLNANGLLARLTGIDHGAPGGANGGIILCHLGSDRRRDYLDQVLGAAIDELRSRGYRFVNVTTMFAEK